MAQGIGLAFKDPSIAPASGMSYGGKHFYFSRDGSSRRVQHTWFTNSRTYVVFAVMLRSGLVAAEHADSSPAYTT